MKIVLATDGTRFSNAGLDMLLRFRLAPGDSIKIVTVVDLALPTALNMYGGYLPDTETLEKDAKSAAHQIVEETRARLATEFSHLASNISFEIKFGSPERRLIEAAEEFGADLIIIGSHGYNQWERLLLGSVSNSIVHHAPCSVLIARLPGE
jgi:nucleotide-binding universal stress UspA family protein